MIYGLIFYALKGGQNFRSALPTSPNKEMSNGGRQCLQSTRFEVPEEGDVSID